MNKLLILICLFISVNGFSQIKKFKELGAAEKIWVLCHPFSAKKAHRLTQKAIDEVKQLNDPVFSGYSESGSRKDAMRHAYWMALISHHIGPKRALWLGRAHEKKNKHDFKRGKLEDGSMADEKNMEMDLKNNELGAKVGNECLKCSDEDLIQVLLQFIQEGELFIVKHTSKGEFLDKDDQPISKEKWQGKWENDRVLVPSNYGL